MQSHIKPPSVFNYYIGLLRQDHTKGMLACELRKFGKILRLRVTREKSSKHCKGYGYTTIELLCNEEFFFSQCLFSDFPIYLKRIECPKRLGAEHCSMLRRYAVTENILEKDKELLVGKFKSFGALELDLFHPVKVENQTKYVLHVLFIDQKAVCSLQAFLQRQNFHSFCRVTTFSGTEDIQFDQIVPPVFIRSHIFERSLLVEKRNPGNQLESNPQGISRTTDGPKPYSKDSPGLYPDTTGRANLLGISAQQPSKPKQSKSKPSLEFRSFRKATCTINVNQLARYRLFLNASHHPSNLRLNVAATCISPFRQDIPNKFEASRCNQLATNLTTVFRK